MHVFVNYNAKYIKFEKCVIFQIYLQKKPKTCLPNIDKN